jgi:hypothetical protein
MAIGPIGSSGVSTGLAGLADRFAGKSVPSATEAARKATIADHVAALDEQEPIRSASTTLGTLLDTYL